MSLFARFLLASLFVATVPLSSRAAIIQRDWLAPGDGLLTYDTVSQREWLDLTETQLSLFPGGSLEERYLAILDETMPSGRFEGFINATANDVLALATSAGMDTSTGDFAINAVAAENAINLLGATSLSNRFSGGIVSMSMLRGFIIAFVPVGRANPAAYVDSDFIPNVTYGVWLSRPANIPEPATSLLTFSLLTMVGSFCRRRF